MALTGPQLNDRVLGNLGNRTDKVALAYNWLSDAQTYVLRRSISLGVELKDLAETASGDLTAGSRFWTLPVNCAAIYNLKAIDGTNSRSLVRREAREADQDRPYPESEAQDIPVYYVEWGGYVELLPIPNSGYPVELRFPRWPNAITAATTAAEIKNADDLLIAIATWYGFGHLTNAAAAKFWYDEVEGPAEERMKHRLPRGLLGTFLAVEMYKEDRIRGAEEFLTGDRAATLPSQYWADPFVGL